MSRRHLLRRQLYIAWKETIENYYQTQRINSERGLQVFFCATLLTIFDGAGLKRRLFVEPRLASGNGEAGPQPDVIVCNSRNIIGIIELKYLPRSAPKINKDLDTFAWISSHSDAIRIRNDRYLGVNRPEKEYALTGDAVLCWAGVHRGINDVMSRRVADAVRPYFLELHAITAEDQNPMVISNFRSRNDL